MESYESCEKCKELYNLSTHKPIIFLECLDTVCLKCVQDFVLQNQIEGNQFKCCIDQSHVLNIDPNNLELLKINPTIKRKLEAQTTIPMFCQTHNNQIASYFIQDLNQFVCKFCIADQELIGENETNIRQLSRNGLKQYSEQMIVLFDEGISQLNISQQVMKKISEDDYKFNKSELSDIFAINKLMLQNCLIQKNIDHEIEQLIRKCFPSIKEIKQPQQEQEFVFQDFTLIKRKPKQDLSIIQSIFQQKIDIEVQKKSNSFLQNFIKGWSNLKFKLLYQASTDGFKVQNFHELCDAKGPTVTFYQSEFGQIFGVYTSISMKSEVAGIYELDPELFVFQLDKKTVHYSRDLEKVNCFQYSEFFNSPGNQNEIDITNDISDNQLIIQCKSQNFGQTFKLPLNIESGSILAQIYLGGAQKFRIIEVEVYSIS